MAIVEACQVWIEQRIKEELEQGINPHAVGGIVAAEVMKYFEVNMKAETIEQRARRQKEKNPTNVGSPATTEDQSENQENQENQVSEPAHGGKRKGSGRKPKSSGCKPKLNSASGFPTDACTFAWQYVGMAISQLERVEKGDPTAEEQFNKVIAWIEQRKISFGL